MVDQAPALEVAGPVAARLEPERAACRVPPPTTGMLDASPAVIAAKTVPAAARGTSRVTRSSMALSGTIRTGAAGVLARRGGRGACVPGAEP